MLTPEEISVFVAEIRKDIIYIKAMFDDKCKTYDAHITDGQGVRDRLSVAEEKIRGLYDIIWKIVITGIILPIITSVITVWVMRFPK